MRAVAAAFLLLTAVPAAAGEAPSLYDLKAELVDQQGRGVGLDVHEGRAVVISMFYAKCPHACPALISDIRRIDRALPEATRPRVRYLLVSIDPTDETATFRELMELHGLEGDRWRLTRTDESSVRRIAAALGVKYRRLPDGSWNHSSIVTVLDPEGRLVHAAEGLALAHEDTVTALTAAAARP